MASIISILCYIIVWYITSKDTVVRGTISQNTVVQDSTSRDTVVRRTISQNTVVQDSTIRANFMEGISTGENIIPGTIVQGADV